MKVCRAIVCEGNVLTGIELIGQRDRSREIGEVGVGLVAVVELDVQDALLRLGLHSDLQEIVLEDDVAVLEQEFFRRLHRSRGRLHSRCGCWKRVQTRIVEETVGLDGIQRNEKAVLLLLLLLLLLIEMDLSRREG